MHLFGGYSIRSHCIISGILALSATQQFYPMVEIANKVLPSLCALTVDPEKQVRDQAFKAMKGFLEKLGKASENPELIPELESQVQAGGGQGVLSSERVPHWASWAVSALSGKFYKSAAPQPSKTGEDKVPTGQKPADPLTNQKTAPEPSINEKRPTDTGGGWSDSEDWGLIEVEDEEETRKAEKSPPIAMKELAGKSKDSDAKTADLNVWDEDDEDESFQGWDDFPPPQPKGVRA